METKEGIFSKDFQIRVYNEDDGMIVEVSKVVNPEMLQNIINFLEKLRE